MTESKLFVGLMTYILFVYFVFGSSDDNSKSDDGNNDDGNNDDNDGDIDGDNDDSSGDGGRSRNDTNKGGNFISRQKVRKTRNRRKHYTGKRKFGSEESKNESDDEIDAELFKSDDEEVKNIINDMKSDRIKVTYRNENITFLCGFTKEIHIRVGD